MSLAKGLLIEPRPCPFCGGEELELRAVIFRQWNVHCLDNACRCKGPDGLTPDDAIIKWNTVCDKSITERQEISTMQKDYQSPTITEKIWRAARAMRTFTATEAARITECNRETVYKYLNLLEKNNYLRIETQKNAPGAPNVYRCINVGQVKAPTWIELKLSEEEYQHYRRDKKALRWSKMKAAHS